MRVSPIIGRAGGMKTYAEFQAYVAAQASGGLIEWYGAFVSAGRYRLIGTNYNPSFMSLNGTTWGTSSANGFRSNVSAGGGAVIHGLPSQAIADALVAAGREVLVTVVTLSGSAATLALTRNGLTSTATASSVGRMAMTRLDYFDPALGPMTMNPSAGAGPTPLTW